ncbi:hypothetical protein NW813_05280 [Synechococcus sp. R55.6]|uniref:hypothetical protein n=1 Tax=unclassified Synechococcus TaxID=2626047 RepID=UPI0039C45F15
MLAISDTAFSLIGVAPLSLLVLVNPDGVLGIQNLSNGRHPANLWAEITGWGGQNPAPVA